MFKMLEHLLDFDIMESQPQMLIVNYTDYNVVF